MLIQIRTKDDLVKLLIEGISYAWRINIGRLNNITEVEIYNFSGKAKIVGTFDRENTKVLENGRVAVAFKNAHIEQTDLKWTGQNPIKYKSANEEVELTHDEFEDTYPYKNRISQSDVRMYAGMIDDDGDVHECCYPGAQPDIIVIGKFDNNEEFMGIVIANWCDKYPTDTLIFRDKIVIDIGGWAEDEAGNNLWDDVLKYDSEFQSKIERFYDYLEIDSDDEHRNIRQEITDDIRLSVLYEGRSINLENVKKGNGYELGLKINF